MASNHQNHKAEEENQIKRPRFTKAQLQQYFGLNNPTTAASSSSTVATSSASASSSSGSNNNKKGEKYYLKLLLPIIHRYIIDKNPFKHFNFSKTPLKQLIGGEIEMDWNVLDFKYFATIDLFCYEMISYWISLRACDGSGIQNQQQSLLRGFHTFIMPLWQRCNEGGHLPYIKDYSKESFLTGYKQLQLIRNDLNRARLIIDRVRRREKLKKELLRCSNDHLMQNILQLPPSSLASSSSQHHYMTLGAGNIPLELQASLLTSASLDGLVDVAGSCLGGGLPINRMQRSLSFVSEGGMSLDGTNMMGNMIPRKRGRPRRIFPSSGSSTNGSSTAVHDKKIAILSHPGATSSSTASSNGVNVPNVPILVKYVQGRDKNGKFLKKAPIIIGAAAHPPVIPSSLPPSTPSAAIAPATASLGTASSSVVAVSNQNSVSNNHQNSLNSSSNSSYSNSHSVSSLNSSQLQPVVSQNSHDSISVSSDPLLPPPVSANPPANPTLAPVTDTTSTAEPEKDPLRSESSFTSITSHIRRDHEQSCDETEKETDSNNNDHNNECQNLPLDPDHKEEVITTTTDPTKMEVEGEERPGEKPSEVNGTINSFHSNPIVKAPTAVSIASNLSFLNANRDITIPALTFSLDLDCDEVDAGDEDRGNEGQKVSVEVKDEGNAQTKEKGKRSSSSSSQQKKKKTKKETKDTKVRIKQENGYDSEEGTTMSCHSSESISLLSLSSQRDVPSTSY